MVWLSCAFQEGLFDRGLVYYSRTSVVAFSTFTFVIRPLSKLEVMGCIKLCTSFLLDL
ncbi:uncharacterized protein G2W53_044440 [Senna tora]|uniref:Uncharacterized protein n=1 Tax=Senna tora TaxID=362788 RepID=A0A834SNV0_9FABA|nr:uncharacterized protein G2W53_044440 [Senna tora]